MGLSFLPSTAAPGQSTHPAPAGHAAQQSAWRRHAVALAAACLIAQPLSAWALSLGRIQVQSSLGEPFRAEIAVLESRPQELRGLSLSLGGPEAFRAAGLEYNPSLAGMRITLVNLPDGRDALRLSVDRPVNDPFLDLVVVAEWPGGRIVRSYTVLIDPPNTRPVTPQLPVVAPPAVAAAALPAPTAPEVPAPAPAPAAAPPAPAPARPAANAASSSGKQVKVQPGDTASGIAQAHRESGVSLDQMLLAMLLGNPSAFSNDNINRLRAGATVELPSADQATRVPAAEASRVLWADSTDFNAYRRKLAEMAVGTAAPQASREATGKVEARVEERQAALQSSDRLTLSKGALGTPGDAAARSTQGGDTAAKVAELDRTINELNRLKAAGSAEAGSASGTAAATPGTPGASGPGVTAPTPLPAASAAAAKKETSGGLIEDLLAQPAVQWIGGGLVALLALLAVVRVRQRRSQSLLGGDASADAGSDAAQAEPTAAAATIQTEPAAPASAPFTAPTAPTPTAPSPSSPPAFDFGSISLDLESPQDTQSKAPATAPASSTPDGPLATKLALAEEFRKLGNTDGARTLVAEVLAEAGAADADVHARAEQLRRELG